MSEFTHVLFVGRFFRAVAVAVGAGDGAVVHFQLVATSGDHLCLSRTLQSCCCCCCCYCCCVFSAISGKQSNALAK